MGMRLNGEKTYHSNDIVNSSIKKDKLHQIIYNYQQQNDLKKQLLVKNFRKFPNNRIALFFTVGKNTIIISVSNNTIIL
jgi:hypothetical protein